MGEIIRIKLALTGLLIACSLICGMAQAALIDYKFTLNKSLMKEPFMAGAETIGGGLTPLVFQFQINTNSPNLYGSSIHGLYGDSSASGQLSVGGEMTALAGTSIQIFNQTTYDVFDVWSRGTNDTLFHGRRLYVVFLEVYGSKLM